MLGIFLNYIPKEHRRVVSPLSEILRELPHIDLPFIYDFSTDLT
jgi:hypothetical protein